MCGAQCVYVLVGVCMYVGVCMDMSHVCVLVHLRVRARCQNEVFAFSTSCWAPPSESEVLNGCVLLPQAWRVAWYLTWVPTRGDICKDRGVLLSPNHINKESGQTKAKQY